MALLLAFAMAAPALRAQTPGRPVTVIVGSSPGGGVDRTARILGEKLALVFAQPVVVENRPGGGTRIAIDAVARAVPDGNTLLFVTGESTIDLAFDPRVTPNILDDLAPVTRVAETPILLVVNANSSWHTLAEFIAQAKSKPGTLNYATGGIKTTMQMVGELFKQATGTDIVQVPFKGTVPGIAALIGGQVDAGFAALSSALPYIQAGQLRALGITAEARSRLLPDVPTFAEAGVGGVETRIWYGVLAPRGTPAATVERLAHAFAGVLAAPAMAEQLATMGADPAPTTPAAFGRALHDEVTRYRRVIAIAGLHAE